MFHHLLSCFGQKARCYAWYPRNHQLVCSFTLTVSSILRFCIPKPTATPVRQWFCHGTRMLHMYPHRPCRQRRDLQLICVLAECLVILLENAGSRGFWGFAVGSSSLLLPFLPWEAVMRQGLSCVCELDIDLNNSGCPPHLGYFMSPN